MSSKTGTLREFGKFRLDASTRVLWCEDKPVNLPLKEIEMLCVLTEKSGEVVTKDELMSRVWADAFVEESNVSRNIYGLRKMFKSFGVEDELIQTVPRRGYRFAGEVREIPHGELIIEKFTQTRTVIEIEEKQEEKTHETKAYKKSLVPRFLSPVWAAILVIIALVGAGAFWNYQSRQTETSGLEIKSIVVLPLKPIAANDADKVLSLGLADALISKLGASQKIQVRSLNSVAPYSDAESDSLVIGRKLQAEAVLDGSFQRSGNRLRVSVRLLRVADGEQIWAGTFDETEVDIFKLQDSLSTQVAKSLRWNLTADERENLIKRPTENVEAYEKYLRGRYLWNQRTSKNLLKAIEEFENAVRLDPNFSLAYAGLADCYALLSVYDERPPLEAFPRAKENALIALKLNPNSAEAHTTLAFVSYRFDWNWNEAEREFRRAIELNPNYSTAHHWFGEFLAASGRFDEAVAEYQKALAIDPTSLIINTDFGYALYLARRYDESIYQLRATTNLNPNFPLAFYCLADSLAAVDQKRESVEASIKWLTLTETDAAEIAKMQLAFGENDFAGFRQSRLKWVETEARKNKFTKVDLSRFYADSADNDNALKWLESAFRERAADLVFIHKHPGFDNLRRDPRFQEILRQMNLQ